MGHLIGGPVSLSGEPVQPGRVRCEPFYHQSQ